MEFQKKFCLIKNIKNGNVTDEILCVAKLIKNGNELNLSFGSVEKLPYNFYVQIYNGDSKVFEKATSPHEEINFKLLFNPQDISICILAGAQVVGFFGAKEVLKICTRPSLFDYTDDDIEKIIDNELRLIKIENEQNKSLCEIGCNELVVCKTKNDNGMEIKSKTGASKIDKVRGVESYDEEVFKNSTNCECKNANLKTESVNNGGLKSSAKVGSADAICEAKSFDENVLKDNANADSSVVSAKKLDLGNKVDNKEKVSGKKNLNCVLLKPLYLKKELRYFRQIELSLSELFANCARERVLECLFLKSKWVKAETPTGFMVVGIIYENNKPNKIGMGYPVREETTKFKDTKMGRMFYYPISANTKFGYYLTFKNATDGAYCKIP